MGVINCVFYQRSRGQVKQQWGKVISLVNVNCFCTVRAAVYTETLPGSS